MLTAVCLCAHCCYWALLLPSQEPCTLCPDLTQIESQCYLTSLPTWRTAIVPQSIVAWLGEAKHWLGYDGRSMQQGPRRDRISSIKLDRDKERSIVEQRCLILPRHLPLSSSAIRGNLYLLASSPIHCFCSSRAWQTPSSICVCICLSKSFSVLKD